LQYYYSVKENEWIQGFRFVTVGKKNKRSRIIFKSKKVKELSIKRNISSLKIKKAPGIKS
jgi:hypothetical protein